MPETITSETRLDFFKETRELFRETAKHMRETDRRVEATDRKIKEVGHIVGSLGNRLGEFVENLVAPAAVRLFQERGIEVHQLFPNARAQRGSEGIEEDLLAVIGNELVATECKSKLTPENVHKHVAPGKNPPYVSPVGESPHLGRGGQHGFDQTAARYAEEKGLFVIAPSGDSVEIRNSRDFLPTPY